MSIAARFADALAASNGPEVRGPELLPVRLARACARTLQVDGAGISMLDRLRQRMPLGGSSDTAEAAERLQFTAGEGPCIAAQNTRQPVFSVEDDLRARWPQFTDLLVRATPFRAIVALPLRPGLIEAGAIDLFFTDSARVPELDVFEALAVGELVSSALSDAAVWSSWSAAEGPDWVRGPAPRGRAAVWEAMGKVSIVLDVHARDALALVRATAVAQGRTADDVAADLVVGRLTATDLKRHGPP